MNQYIPKADFLVLDTHNLKTLGIGDISYYPQTFIVQNPTLEITPPNLPKKNVIITAKAITMLNSNDIGLTCTTDDCEIADIPDGIWKIKYSFSPALENFVEKTFLRTEVLQEKFGTAFLKTDISECDYRVKEQDMEKIDEIWYYIQEAIAAGIKCNDVRAMKLYKLADTRLTNFLNSKA